MFSGGFTSSNGTQLLFDNRQGIIRVFSSFYGITLGFIRATIFSIELGSIGPFFIGNVGYSFFHFVESHTVCSTLRRISMGRNRDGTLSGQGHRFRTQQLFDTLNIGQRQSSQGLQRANVLRYFSSREGMIYHAASTTYLYRRSKGIIRIMFTTLRYFSRLSSHSSYEMTHVVISMLSSFIGQVSSFGQRISGIMTKYSWHGIGRV